jgi:HsdM N-terminal domain
MAAGSAPEGRRFGHFSEIAGFIWQIADLLRGDYKQADYGKVVLPFTVLRRLDCVLERTKAKVLGRREQLKGGDLKSLDLVLNKVAGVPFHNPEGVRRAVSSLSCTETRGTLQSDSGHGVNGRALGAGSRASRGRTCAGRSTRRTSSVGRTGGAT